MSLQKRLLIFVTLLLLTVVVLLGGLSYLKMRAEIVNGISLERAAHNASHTVAELGKLSTALHELVGRFRL